MPSHDFIPGLVAPSGSVEPRSFLFVARGLELVVDKREGASPVPTFERASSLADGLHFLGSFGGTPCFTANWNDAPLPDGLELVPARSLFGQIDDGLFNAVGRAIAVAEWDRVHRFCGRCGAPTELSTTERARRCPSCQIPFYPRLSPAVIVLIERGEEALLARGANFPGKWFSTLAGFVEPGESLEETVIREVHEEVGVQVTDLRYFGSQPWPYGRSLMIGFNAKHAGGEIRIDPSEIAEARWFRPNDLPQTPPKLSIARQLIDDWLARRRG